MVAGQHLNKDRGTIVEHDSPTTNIEQIELTSVSGIQYYIDLPVLHSTHGPMAHGAYY